jgi:hypothetical protein
MKQVNRKAICLLEPRIAELRVKSCTHLLILDFYSRHSINMAHEANMCKS